VVFLLLSKTAPPFTERINEGFYLFFDLAGCCLCGDGVYFLIAWSNDVKRGAGVLMKKAVLLILCLQGLCLANPLITSVGELKKWTGLPTGGGSDANGYYTERFYTDSKTKEQCVLKTYKQPVEIIADIDENTVVSADNGACTLKLLRKDLRLRDYVWLEGVEGGGEIVLPATGSYVFVASGDVNDPVITQIGRGGEKPYYEIKDGRTHIYVDHFSGGGCASGCLVALWRLNENAASATVSDFSGNSNTGTFTDAGGNPNTNAHDTTGKVGGALTFDGTDDYIAVSGMNTEFGNSDTFTITGWFKTSESLETNMTIIGQWNQEFGSDYYGFNISVDTSVLVARMGNGSITEITGSTDVADDNWHHFAFTYPTSSSNATLYLDGEVEGTPASAIFSATGTAWRIGDGSHIDVGTPTMKGGPFNGSIDTIKVYNHILPVAHIKYLYHRGHGTESPYPVKKIGSSVESTFIGNIFIEAKTKPLFAK